MVFGNNTKDASYDVFRIRYSLDTELGEKTLRKYDKEIKKELKEKIEEETNKIRFRTIQYVEEFLEKTEKRLDQKIEEFKSKNRLAYYKWIEENKKAIKEMIEVTNEDTKTTIDFLANLDEKENEKDFRYYFLLSQIVEQIKDTFITINETLPSERFSRRKTQMTKVIKCFTVFFMILLRIIELEKHWEKADKEKRKVLEDLVYWDLDTMNKITQTLPPKKKDVLNKDLLPDEDLINALWG